ncbi:lysosomal acid lipase/cholesteryl ester hydrolase-like [Podarcis raffonei]|uniref:lysosomal acid lipase/cholesteryl ester hydrolase-like n=1 Tax=Podarcis raffonei TaxID=65483 RepID=UPI0023297DA5|nr:lysosomal acid lipase/cholesteryl ester hydrolase-like [Podarcis raffonei]
MHQTPNIKEWLILIAYAKFQIKDRKNSYSGADCDEVNSLPAPAFSFLSFFQSRADVYVGISPDYTSVKTVVHWGQVAKSNQFKYFDYGPKNGGIYNMSSPPFYKVEDSIVPTAVWSAGRDTIASKRNVEMLLPRITNLVFYKHIPDWQHVDFIWGLDAPERLYKDVLCLMQKYK